MSGRDPFELLSSLRGDDAHGYLKPGDDPAADALLERIMNGTTAERSALRSRQHRRVVVGVMAGVLLGSGAVAAAVLFDRPTDPVTLSCYSDASLDPVVQVGLTIDPESTPVKQCAVLWRDGTLGTTDAPPLVACVTRDGITAVIPGDQESCTSLGLTVRAPSVDPDESMAAQVASAISDRYPTECVDSVDAAVVIVERILVELEADDWQVRPAAAISGERPCAYAALDASARVVLIVTGAGAP